MVRPVLSDNLSPREVAELNWEKEQASMQVDYGLKNKELELKLKEVEIKWAQLLRLPMAFLLLPVKLLGSLAIIAAALRKYDLPAEFWEFLRG